MRWAKNKLWLPGLMAILLFSCVEKEYDFNRLSTEIVYDPKLAFTIGTVNINVESLLRGYTSSGKLQVADDKTIIVILATNFYSYPALEALPLPPQSQVIIPGFIFPPTIPATGVVSRDTTINIPISFFSDAEIDSIVVKTLRYTLSGSSSYSSAFTQELTISLLDMHQGNMVYEETFPISSSINTENQNNAAGYTLKFRNVSAGSAETRLYVRLTLRGTPGSHIDPNSTLNVALQINDLNYRLLYGYIGQPYVFNIMDTMNLDFLGRELAKNIEWKNPSYTLYTSNSYAVPCDLFVDSVWVITYDNRVILTNPDNTKIQNPKDIAYPAQIGLVAKDSVVCDKVGYSAFYRALEREGPKSFVVKLKSKANPHGKTNIINILSDTSRIRTQGVLRIPMSFRSSGFSQTDTMDFDLSNLATGSSDSTNKSNTKVSLKAMLFRIVSSNAMPINMQLQAYFVDENYQVLDSLYKDQPNENYIIKAGTIDVNTGRVNVPRLWKKDVIFNEQRLKNIENAKHVIFRLTASTADYDNTKPFVTIFADSKLSITFAAQIQPSIHVYQSK